MSLRKMSSALMFVGLALTAAVTTLPAFSQVNREIGPTFECSAARDPVAVTICSDAGLKRIDIEFVQAYQALRHQLSDDQRPALRQDAVAFHAFVIRTCELPQSGNVPPANRARVLSCMEQAYRSKRADYMRWLNPVAREEVTRDASEHVALQVLLANVAGATSPVAPNGVYGAPTRTALSTFQVSRGLAQSGFLDNATAEALRRPIVAAPPPFSPPERAAAPSPAQLPSAAPSETPRGYISPIAALPCSAVSLQIVRQTRWGPGFTQFGMPGERWTKEDYAALIARINACMGENRDDPRNFIGMRQYIESQRSSAPDPRGEEVRRAARAREEAEKAERARLEREEAERRRVAENQYHAARAADMRREDEARRVALRQATLEAAAREPAFDCADPSTLRQVQRLMEEQSNPLVTVRVLRLYEPGLTAEHPAVGESTLDIRGRYRAVGATSPEERNLVRIQIGLPRCAVRALTNQGDSIVGYEKIERGGQQFLRIRPGFL